MRFFYSLLILAVATLFLSFTPSSSWNGGMLEPFIELKFSQTSGTNGCAVAYNAEKKLYYAAIAGNASYPLEVFNETGFNVYRSTCKIDVRGLWFNEDKQRLEGNMPGESGVFYIDLDSKGYPTGEPKMIKDFIKMPDFQSAGDFTGKEVIFYAGNGFNRCKGKGNYKLKKYVEFSGTSSTASYNSTSVVYTGIKKQEVAAYDYVNNKINVFSLKGKFSQELGLPFGYPTPERFCFSYANGAFFLYDIRSRTWTGFR